MARHSFFCIDGHTCGNPVRLVTGGSIPTLAGATMFERRQHFLAEHDWIRKSLMFEPRGHDMMSGSILYPPTRPDCDVAILFIETSGCLPMCGHGTIGTVTMMLEHGLVTPREPGRLLLDTPAGVVEARYVQNGPYVDSVTLTNVPSFLLGRGYEVEVEGFGTLSVDVAFGGNFYAIVEPQPGYEDLSALQPSDVLRLSPRLRTAFNARHRIVHPANPALDRLTHVMWTGRPMTAGGTARNAVFYGDKAIDRSPCGTGTSARMAQLHATGRLAAGTDFIHESIIGSTFTGRVVGETMVGDLPAIIPSIGGWARTTGFNTIFVDDRDPFWQGFQVAEAT
ncbi:4-hydroxyproline epimerase [Azospirillum picis]|uniref:4-hydroxyproline epimerase n=1 Tax=Azospirillum picis TaxID=488438 RepID=A0ABU0MMK9_9PROT|nr:4-hydroxyproline epimerase [Azospirillum picis]MBP2300732.1 4-hydroxyproline epimerase [Azospirillum picis]MDQ0534701.1 4-hydroxyproline epimerase [Azospirillum picis]